MTNITSPNPNNGILSTDEINSFMKYLCELDEEQLIHLSTLLYGTLIPTLANNRVVDHKFIFVHSLFMLIRMWLNQLLDLPYTHKIPIVFFDERVMSNVYYYYYEDESRREYIDKVLTSVFKVFLLNSATIYPTISSN